MPTRPQRARAVNERWPEGGQCSDEGHIDWLMRSAAPTADQWRLRAILVGVCTELMCPPLPPRDPSLFGGPKKLPPGGCIFPSDHYPVFADIKFSRSRGLAKGARLT